MKSRILGLAVACALFSMQARAVGLGTIEVKSKLNQPFVAEIPLTLNDPSEANGLVVRLASPEAFERIGMDPRELSANLQFSVGKNARGEPVVRVTTPQRMNDPYVTFLLEADWGKGKMVREYTALLDPPHTASVPRRAISAPTVASTPLPAPVVMQPVTPLAEPAPPVAAAPEQPLQPAPIPMQSAPEQPAPIVAAPQPEPPMPMAAAPQPEPSQPMAAAPQPESLPVPPEPPPPAPVVAAAPPALAPMPEPASAPEAPKAAPGAVTVGRGQSLLMIADQVRPADVSINRMMIALQRTNPDAFIHDNINLLKSGAVLRIPGSEQTQAVTTSEANTLVREQVENWHQGAQPAPQLQPEETADTSSRTTKPAAPKKAAATGAVAASVHPAAPKIKTEPAAAPAPDRAPVAAQADATPSAPKVSKPRGAHLEIVPPAGSATASSQTGASEGGSGSELRAQLAQTKEELAARNSEVNDLKSRVSDLEKMQKDSTQLLSMKDSQLAAMQQRLADLEKSNAAAPAPPASAEPAPASTASVAANVAVPASNSSTATMAATATPPPKPAVVAAPSKPAAQQAEPVVEPTPWYLQPFVLIGGGLLVLGGLLGLMLRRPREADSAPRPRSFDANALVASMAAAREPDAPTADEAAHEDVPESASSEARTADVHAAGVQQAPGQPSWTSPMQVQLQPVDAAHVGKDAPSAEPKPSAVPAAATAHDEWDIPDAPTPAPTATPAAAASLAATAVRPAVPAFDDPNQSVATKLELARAYIDIGDADGARGMLEEVLIEGNAAQQQAAFELLDTLES